MPITKMNSSGQDFSHLADGFDIAGGITARKLTISGGDIVFSGNGTYTLPSATATILTTNALITVLQGGTGVGTLTGLVKGNGTSAFSAAAAGTDFVAPGLTTSSGLTMATARILGRTTASTGAVEEISIGGGLTLSGGILSNSGATGTVTSVSVVTANGFAGSVATATTTPAITITTSITGLLKGNGTAISAAISGTDFALPNQTFFLGTTSIAINRSSGAIALTGITSIDGQAATVVTNANLTGIVTSVGNATSIAAGAIGLDRLVAGTAGQIIVGAVTTGIPVYRTMTGDVSINDTGVTAIAASIVTGKLITGFVSGSGSVTATDTILQAINKLDGNIGLKANTNSPTFTGTVVLPAGQVINGVTLSTAQGTTNFLRGDGTYANPKMVYTEVTGTTQAAVADAGYIASNASLVTVTLPTTAIVGTLVAVSGKGAGGWRVSQNASQIIHFSTKDTATGVSGYMASTNRYDAVELICTIANLEWAVKSSVGNITLNF